MSNKEAQTEEVEVLLSIYGHEWHKEIDGENSFSIAITKDVKFFVELNDDYPSKGPPTYQLLAPRLDKHMKNQIALSLDEIYLDNLGEPILFQWIEKLKELLQHSETKQNDAELAVETSTDDSSQQTLTVCNFRVSHGPTIVDRKSIFQGHVLEATKLDDVKNGIAFILQNRKIAQATHNISAHVIKLDNGRILQDFDDDGEKHAGGRLLHLLQMMKVENVLVVVSRWYGGINLGPDRFRHINNAARQALSECGYITQSTN